MKHKLFRISYIFASMVAVFSLLPAPTTHAAPSSIYFSPTSGTYNLNANFSVQVRGNSDSIYYNTGTTSGAVTFPANRLRAVSVSTSGSSYSNMSATINNSAGTVSWSASAYPAPTSIYFFTINFQAISAGTAGLGFSSDTNVNHNSFSQIYSTNKGTASYTIPSPPPATCPSGQIGTPPNCTTPPPATCPSGQVGTPPNCTTPSTPKPTPNPTPSPSPTPSTPTVSDTSVPTATAQPDVPPTQVDAGDLSIKDVMAKVTRKSNTLEWKTSLVDVNSEIVLGTSKENLTVKPTVTRQANGSFASTMENLKPGVRYYFTISAIATNNPEKKATFSGAFTTRGYPATLVVTKDGKKIANATVVLEKQSFKTDKNGELQLELTDTSFEAKITLPDKTTKTVNFTVAKKSIPSNGDDPAAQVFTFDLSEQNSSATAGGNSLWIPLLGGLGALGALIVGGVLFLLYRRRKADEGTDQANISPYTWEQGNAGSPAPEPTSTYNPIVDEQQAANLASIEQQYVPETEVQPEIVYETQQPELVAQMPDTASLEEPMAQPIEYSAQPIDVQPVGEELVQQLVEAAPQETPASVAFIQDDTSSPTLATEDVKVASADDSEINEEEAVYHPDTGELDIIHSHTAVDIPPPPDPLSLQTSSNVSNIADLPLPPQGDSSAKNGDLPTPIERAA